MERNMPPKRYPSFTPARTAPAMVPSSRTRMIHSSSYPSYTPATTAPAVGIGMASDARRLYSPGRTAASSSTPSLTAAAASIQPINETVAAPPTETLTKLKPGVAYILNHENFLTKNRRLGSNQDVKSLDKVFNKYKLEIQVHNDPTKKIVTEIGDDIRKRDFSKNSCVVVVILSHGGRHESVLAYEGESYNIDDELLFPMHENETLKGKPKIFFVQTCKGDFHVSTDGAQLVTDAKPNTPLNAPQEILKCYSTFEGFVSFRDEDNGSIFIQELCKLLDEQGKTVDIYTIMDQVTQKVWATSKEKQVPAITTTLMKKYCFGDYCD